LRLTRLDCDVFGYYRQTCVVAEVVGYTGFLGSSQKHGKLYGDLSYLNYTTF